MGNCEMFCDQFESDKNQILITKHKKGKGKGILQPTQIRHNHKVEQPIDDSSKDFINNNIINNSTMSPKEKEKYQKGIVPNLYTPSTLNNSQRELFPQRETGIKYEKELMKIIKLQRTYKQKLNNIKDVKLIIVRDDTKKYVGFVLKYNNDIKHTFGIMKWNDGDKYRGTFYNDLYNGYGRYLTNESGTTFEGQFKNNEMNGFGIERWKLGSVFIGEYVNNEKSGIGTMNFDDQFVFKGEFKENNINGYGTLTQSNITIRGYYANNQLDQYGIWEDKCRKRRYEGEMNSLGEWEGFGILFDCDNTISIGKWHQSKLNGEAITIQANRKLEKCVYSKSKIIKVLQPDKITLYETIAIQIIRGEY